MLWCKDFLFLHYPKTAGKTLSRFFLQSWKQPVHGYVSQGQIAELADYLPDDSQVQVGRGHENLKEADAILRELGGGVDQLKAVFVATRNPYDLMVSNYHFMRETYQHNQEKRNFQIAHENDFESFCEKVGVATPKNWMEFNGKPIANLHRIRFEHLAEDLDHCASEYGFNQASIDHLNASRRGHYRDYMTQRSEEAIHRKFRYYFNKKFYTRELVSNAGDSVESEQRRVG